MLALLQLAACPGDDTGTPPANLHTGEADTAPVLDSDDTGAGSRGGPLDGAALVVNGEASSAAGFGLAFAPDDEGRDDAWFTAYFTSRVCRFEGEVGTLEIAAAPLCLTATGSGEYMGASIATSGSLVALGAVGGREAGAYAGKLYLFDVVHRSGEVRSEEASAVILAEAAGDYLGNATAFVGDAHGDGHDDLLVGAPSNDGHGAGAGKAYLFTSGLAAEQSAALATTTVYGTSSTSAVRHGAPEAGDGVGSVLNAAGDVNADGTPDFILGCNGADDGGANAGLAAVFFGPAPAGEVSLRDADLLYLGDTDDLYVGDFADGIGDSNGDGYAEVAVSGDVALAGKVWIFAGPGTSGTVASAATTLVGEADDDQAGASLAGAGDFDGDGASDLVVGAYGADTSGLDAGASYVFLAPFPDGTASMATAHERWTGLVAGDGAGRAVEGSGDYDGDGLADVLVGAPYADVGGLAFSGQAFLVLGARR